MYEMNKWATVAHPGNMAFAPDANPIKAVAKLNNTVLAFPTSHDMARFSSALGSGGLVLLGKLSETVTFGNLPSTVQTAEVAAAFGALVEGTTTESCGSPGEVANDPLSDNHFKMDGNGAIDGGPTEGLYLHSYDKYHGYAHIIYVHLALHAQDQLRQRTAHALIQVRTHYHPASLAVKLCGRLCAHAGSRHCLD